MNESNLPGGKLLMITGMFLAAFGLLALLSPIAAGGMVVRVVALILLVTGIAQVVHAFRSSRQTEKTMSYIFGVIVAGLGVMVWFSPEVGGGFLTILLMVFFVAHGIWKLSTAWRYRQAPAWTWLLISGLLSLLFVIFLWRQWPLSGPMAIGILVGIDLLFSGITLIFLARSMRSLARAAW